MAAISICGQDEDQEVLRTSAAVNGRPAQPHAACLPMANNGPKMLHLSYAAATLADSASSLRVAISVA